ncbi:acyltransferase [Marinobacter halodurans]|uniref:Acyltransferase n=1 Tax=Marinobacter halodurans TaxID=2528979 RepID=A0ABY1ZSP2_9GAMM|nr:acyltransferase [Marinobacter halodurans]TBW58085.1 acyltransferase [Marinobacter halodurans]
MSEVASHLSTGERNDAFARVQAKPQLDLNVETLRGFAILMVVIFHVIGPKSYEGLQIQEPGSLYHLVTDIFDYLQMPLFSFLAGYVYAIRPFGGGAGAFVKGKAQRLLVPMLVVGTFFAVVKSMAPGTNMPLTASDFFTLHIIPVQHFWFVESLFWIFLLMMVLDGARLLSSGRSFAVVAAVACGIHLAWQKPPIYFSFAGIIYLLPSFLLGVACYRFRDAIFQPAVLWPVGIVTAACSVLIGLTLVGVIDHRFMPQSLPSLIVGCGLSLLLMVSQWKQRWLVFIGAYAYTIYIFHVFGTSGSRIILQKLGVTDTFLLLVVGVLCGVVGPIIVDLLASRYRWSRKILLGKKR